MRSVPHRVVCLLGLDDGAFPRKAPRDGDDLTLDDPRVGERDARAEDRQLLLDALLAAQERLVITYTGNDERTNIVRPPAVPVGELLDVLDRTATTADSKPARDHVVVRHPLQPFDPRNFMEGKLGRERPWSFDAVTLEGARALTADHRDPPPPFLDGELAPRDERLVELGDLVAFVEHPARAFLRQRLKLRVGDYEDEVADALPVELEGLEKWGIGERMLRARLAGADARAAYRAEIARGALPPGLLGRPVVKEVIDVVEDIVRVATQYTAGEPATAEVRVTLDDGRAVTGTVPGHAGRRAPARPVLERRPQAPARGLGAAARAGRRAARPPPQRRHRRARRRRRRRAHDPAARPAAARAHLTEPGRPPRARPAPAAPARLQDVRGVRRRRRVRRPPGVDVDRLRARPRGPRPRASARLRRRAALRRPARAAGVRRRRACAVGPAARGRAMTTAPVSRPFDVCGPLPAEGITVLEASAGTGKTYTIAALAARYVAGGLPLSELLLVTFTRMATGELRERVRERLVSAERGLERVLNGAEPDDAVVALLATGERGDVVLRHGHLARALADFDAATIVTTHGFCQEVLAGLGVAGDVDADVNFVEDPTDLVEQVVDDLYVRKFHGLEDGAAFKRAQALEIAKLAVNNPAAPILPSDGAAGDVPLMRAKLAQAVRDEVDRRKRLGAILTYDDFLTRLDDTLREDAGGGVAAYLRDRYRVVLVDEFQDTDPVQWSIMRRAFGSGVGTLVLIGDPKQAIYAFRGADVFAYLEAARAAEERPTLDRNYRSDQGLLDAYDAVFGGARLGHEGIVYRRVQAADENQAPRLTGAPDPAPLRIRVVHRDDPALTTVGQGAFLQVDSARAHVARDVAADLVELLSSGAKVEGEPIGAGHVAVLVRTNKAAALVRDALEEVAIPAVINGAGSVFGTPQARDWLRLLQAIERPAWTLPARGAALTPFFGWTAERVASAGEAEWAELHQTLHRWARVLRVRGVASLAEEINLGMGLPERVLATAGGERRLTDLRHVGQLLHAAARADHLGTTALIGWLRKRIAEAHTDTGDEERSRRLESDAEAVQVLTIHRSKGLEFPVVYLPYLWDPTHVPRDPVPIAFHDPDHDDRRTLDVGLEGRDYSEHRRRHIEEERGEDLRLAYVALTRAKHQAVVWWAAAKSSKDSSLSRLLFDRDEAGNVAWSGTHTPSDEVATERFGELAARAPGRISVARSVVGAPHPWEPPRSAPADLAAAELHRDVDWRWRRTSFSDITAGAHDEARVASEPEEPVLADEPADLVLAAGAAAAPPARRRRRAPSPRRHAGGRPGRDVRARGLRSRRLRRRRPPRRAGRARRRRTGTAGRRDRRRRRRRRGARGGDRDAGPRRPAPARRRARRPPRRAHVRAAARRRRRAVGEAHARDDRRGAPRARRAVRRAPRRPVAPAQRPRLSDRQHRPRPARRRALRGRRLQDELARHARRTELTAWHYRPEALAEAMERSHYMLQALLYTVALHRYLRWRLAGYDPERHLAGVLYLFVRGMTGATGAGRRVRLAPRARARRRR